MPSSRTLQVIVFAAPLADLVFWHKTCLNRFIGVQEQLEMTISRILHLTERELRVACYLLGPLMAIPILLRRSEFWSVRFHAAHSILTSAFCAASWGGLRLLEHISPTWFLGAVMREARYLVNLIWAVLWVLLLITAYSGVRFVILPWLHAAAIRFARRYEPSGSKTRGPVLQAN